MTALHSIEGGLDAQQCLSASLLRLRARQPFFAALALFARYELTSEVPTAATDGAAIFINPVFWNALEPTQQDGLLLHEVLHAALGHCTRRGDRDVRLWNTAADIVVNGMILAESDLALPAGGMRDDKLAHFSTEEVYEILKRERPDIPAPEMADLMESEDGEIDTAGSIAQAAALQRHWADAMQKARTIMRSMGQEAPPMSMRRELECLEPGHIDWRSWLWRYLVHTPTDFSGYDRRFVGRGLYLEALEGESVRVHVCLDTSGSVTDAQMRAFLGEVQGILSAYPHLVCDLYYADSALNGPHRLDAFESPPRALGGGGTNFRPFFEHVERTQEYGETALAIYLTDGYGHFPEWQPRIPVLWVVTAGGLDLKRFPFGERIRLTG
jgi:predicted metal-dependent peptidase